MDTSLHGTDEQLELYALGRLGDSESAVIEGHLLVCAGCRERLDETEAFAIGIREALRMDPPPAEAASHGWLEGVLNSLRQPVLGIALAAALVAIIAFAFFSNRTSFAPAASLQLTALRGEMASAPPANEIDLTLSDAPKNGGPFRIEVVDAAGKQLWNATGTEARVQRRFASGVYFVRLYSASGQLVREYGFTVKKQP